MMKNCENEHFHSAFSDYESFDHNSSTSCLLKTFAAYLSSEI